MFLLENYNESSPINVGNTKEYSIREVAEIIAKIYDYDGEIIWDTSGPPGQFRKPSSNQNLLDLGFSEDKYTDFNTAIRTVCKWFENHYEEARGVEL